MNDLKNNYRDVDYAPLVLNAGEYERMKDAIKDFKNPKGKIKLN